MEQTEHSLYAPGVLDLVRVSTEYCKFMEHDAPPAQADYVDVLRGLLPMLYLKLSLLPPVGEASGFNEPRVTEADYDYVRCKAAGVMGGADDYLDVFVRDFKYSDTPILRTVSEGLADIYQALRELVEVFRLGHEEAMTVALADVSEQFKDYLGQTLLNTLKALHDVRFGDRYE